MDAQNPRKRKRSAIACTRCHDRKVRCSAAFQGLPCANCAQDGTRCIIYQPQSARQDPPAAGDDRHKGPSPAYPLTPTPSLVPPAEVGQRVDAAATSRSALDVDVDVDVGADSVPAHVVSPDRTNEGRPRPNAGASNPRPERVPREGLVPYYSGEEGGLEFMFDVCSPNRPVKGGPYIVSRNVHKAQRFRSEVGSRPSFPPAIYRQFLRCFFTYVYPFLPVVHAGDFITKYSNNPDSVSSLLLWSMFLAAASFLDADTLRAVGFKSRKQLKEYCYQHTKATYDAQLETDKPTIIASTLLLATWYVDLEDLDGTGYWIGIALHHCSSIGLHREPNYTRLPRCPFPAAQQSLWRRLWWCAYYRDAWFCLGAGRPMRVHIDDCDLHLPTVEDVTQDFKDLPPELRDQFLPSMMEEVTELWIRMLHLSVKLEHIMVLHYRPRRPPLSMAQLQSDHTDTLGLLAGLEQLVEHEHRILTLHTSHFRTYVNTVVIVLHRSYMLSAPKHLSSDEQQSLQKGAVHACKTAAAEITSTLNKLVAEDMIETSPNPLVTPIMMAMQIHFYELAKTEGLLKQHALHNMNLHFMVLKHLKKTFWTADLHHNLFTECVKALDGNTSEGSQYAGYAAGLQDPSVATARSSTPHASRDDNGSTMTTVLESSGLIESAFEEFFASFGPFDNFACLLEDRIDYNNTTDTGLV